MPIKRSEHMRSKYDPGPDELDIHLPHNDHRLEFLDMRQNVLLQINRLPDGGAAISCREDIHRWGPTETIRLDKEAWEVVQAFVAGGPGDSYLTPYRLTTTSEWAKNYVKKTSEIA